MSEERRIPASSKVKKLVRFADCEGKSLSKVYWINCQRDKINGYGEKQSNFYRGERIMGGKAFSLQINAKIRDDRLKRCHVSLDNIIKSERGIFGTIAVKNIAYRKEVSIAYSFDSWLSAFPEKASFYKQNKEQGIDYFIFAISKRFPSLDYQWRISFAICYKVSGYEYWDNNNGHNYTVTSNIFEADNFWGD